MESEEEVANRLYETASKSALKRAKKALIVTMCLIRLKRGADKNRESYNRVNADVLIDHIQQSVSRYPNLARLC